MPRFGNLFAPIRKSLLDRDDDRDPFDSLPPLDGSGLSPGPPMPKPSSIWWKQPKKCSRPNGKQMKHSGHVGLKMRKWRPAKRKSSASANRSRKQGAGERPQGDFAILMNPTATKG